MLPSAGGRSGLGSTAAAAPGTPGVRAEFALIATRLTAASGIAAVTLIAARVLHSSRLFNRPLLWREVHVLARILRGRATGRNANYRSIPAKNPTARGM